MPTAIPPSTPALRRSLLAWFDRHQRNMPWRARHPQRAEAWAVLVSEFMLQQTQVATVIPYFERFMATFPTPTALAEAPEQEVLRLWQGLGYYRRAKNLHRAAQAIAAQHAGKVPDTHAALLALPGIGPYTAGAIASIAFGLRQGVVDGNVARVVSRWTATHRDPASALGKKALWSFAQTLADHPRAGCLNQAVMELGATVCTPRAPACAACPLQKTCRAHANGRMESYPLTIKAAPIKRVIFRMLRVERHGQVLLTQRPHSGLWAGMWALPTLESQDAAPEDHIQGEFGLQTGEWIQTESFTHILTHRSIRFEVWTTQVQSGILNARAGQFRKPDDIADLPLPNPYRRALAR